MEGRERHPLRAIGPQPDTPVSVGYDQTATVLVNVTATARAISGDVDSTTITAISRADGAVQAAATDTTAADHVFSVALGPDRAKLTNPGNDPDTFDLTHESSQGWSVLIPDGTLSLSYSNLPAPPIALRRPVL